MVLLQVQGRVGQVTRTAELWPRARNVVTQGSSAEGSASASIIQVSADASDQAGHEAIVVLQRTYNAGEAPRAGGQVHSRNDTSNTRLR